MFMAALNPLGCCCSAASSTTPLQRVYFMTSIDSQQSHLDNSTRVTWVRFLRFVYSAAVVIGAILFVFFTLWASLVGVR